MSENDPPPGGPDRPFEEPGQPEGSPPPPPPPYGTPPSYGGGPPYGAPMASYGAGLPVPHNGATTSLVLGIASIAVAVIGTCLCFFLGAAAVVVGPFGIWQAQRARAEIDAEPARYGNRGNAVAGLVCSIVGTTLGALVLVASVVLVVGLGYSGLADMTN